MEVTIGDKTIGPGHPVYVVAEIGGNHDGDLKQAYRLIVAAAEAGADAAKFQFFNPETLYPGKHTPGAVPAQWLLFLKDACHEAGIEFLCSVFDLETLAAYLNVEPVAVKIASPEATNRGLVEAAAASGVLLLVSTGAMTQKQVDVTSMEFMRGCKPHVLLHCVSAYPANPEELNLRVIREMQARYAVPVGFSDHTTDSALGPTLAVAAGACMIEKHLTLDRYFSGPDHRFALEPDQFRVMVENIRVTEEMLGDGVKRVQPGEDPTDRR